MANEPNKPHITAIILCGGKGERLGHEDKGLALYRGKPLVEHVISRLTPQVSTLLINCNRNFDEYHRFDLPLVQDNYPDRAGPLRGIISCWPRVDTPFALIVPCDMPHLPRDLVDRLMWSEEEPYEISCCHDGSRQQSLIFIAKTPILSTIDGQLNQGKRAVNEWLATRKVKSVSFAADSVIEPQEANPFENINRLDQLDPEGES